MKAINYIHIKNMFVHKDTKIEFQEGKNFIIGPVGAGKTLISEAISFCLFGSSALRGSIKGYDKDLSIELSFNHKNETFLVKRKITDSSLSIYDKDSSTFMEICNSVTAVNQKIINLLGYNYDIYLLSNYCQQKKLSYFSDLTPAKRLSYIYKISGITDSKEYKDYLTSLRKTFKSNLTLLKDLIVTPQPPEGIDQIEEYHNQLKILDESSSTLSELYQEYEENLKKSICTLLPPVLNLSDINRKLLDLSDNQIEEIEKTFNAFSTLEKEIQAVEDELKSLPKLPSKELEDLSLEQVNLFIQDYNNKLVNQLTEFEIDCPNCNHSFHLTPRKILSESNLDIQTLYVVKDYLDKNIKEIKRNLEKQIRTLDRDYNKIYDNFEYSSFKNFNNFITIYTESKQTYLEYTNEYNLYQQILEESVRFKTKSDELKTQIDEILQSQSEKEQIRNQYFKLQTLKEVYEKRLEVYETSVNKFKTFEIKINILNTLINGVEEISEKLKEDSLPLINYYASYYLNLITKGVMSSIEVTPSYDLIVDGVDIKLKSGGQTDIASLCWRLALSKSVVSGMLNFLLLDEVDSSGGKESVDDIMEAIETISSTGFQTIIITHKDISNVENSNIIQL